MWSYNHRVDVACAWDWSLNGSNNVWCHLQPPSICSQSVPWLPRMICETHPFITVSKQQKKGKKKSKVRHERVEHLATSIYTLLLHPRERLEAPAFSPHHCSDYHLVNEGFSAGSIYANESNKCWSESDTKTTWLRKSLINWCCKSGEGDATTPVNVSRPSTSQIGV